MKPEEYEYKEDEWADVVKKVQDYGEKALNSTPIIVVVVIVCIFIAVFCFAVCYVKCKKDKEKEEHMREEAKAIQEVYA